MMSRDFGFSGKDGKLDLSGFAPRPAVENTTPPREESIAEQSAERAGFHSRSPVERVARVRKPSQPFDQAFVRAPVDVINRFKLFCNNTGLSYGEALDELMRRSGV